MILLLEPVTGILLDVVFLGQQLTWNIVVGGLIILTANLLLLRHTSSCEGKCKRFCLFTPKTAPKFGAVEVENGKVNFFSVF